MIYFILCNKEFIKIGYSQDPTSRLADLQVANPYELTMLGKFPGTKWHEKKLHGMFSKYIVRGEWFKSCDDIVTFVLESQKSKRLAFERTKQPRNKKTSRIRGCKVFFTELRR